MSQLQTNTATIDELISIANSLPDAGSGGEDVSAETAEYTSLLTDLETAIDSLPDAGSGGSGGSVETCTVTFTSSSMAGKKVSYSALDIDGMITSNVETFVEEGTESKVELNNVVCGSALSINYPAECTHIVGTASLIYADEYFLVFKAPNVANENCIVVL